MTQLDHNNMPNSEVALTGRLAEFREALKLEIDTVSRSMLTFVLRNGHNISGVGDSYVYRFYVEYGGAISADTPCTLVYENNRYDVTIIGYEESFLTISCKTNLGDTVPKAQLENGSVVLMKKLIERIEQKAAAPNPAGDRMLLEAASRVIADKPILEDGALNEQQKLAIKKALTENITYIWGPPGTGKTTVISNIIMGLFEHERSVLLVSHTSTAVDGAMRHVCKRLKVEEEKSNSSFPALRLGSSIDPRLAIDYPEITIDAHISALSTELIAKRTQLEQEEAEKRSTIRRLEHDKRVISWLEGWPAMQQKYNDLLHNWQDNNTECDILTAAIKEQKVVLSELNDYCLTALKYFSAVKDCRTLENDQHRTRLAHQQLLNELSQAKALIEKGEDDLVSYQYRQQITSQLAQHLSLPAQQQRIQRLREQQTQLDNRSASLQQQIVAQQNILAKSQARGSLGRMFSGLDSPDKIQQQISQLRRNAEEVNRENMVNKQLRQEYEAEIFETEKLKTKLDSLNQVVDPDKARASITKNSSRVAEITRQIMQAEKQIADAGQKVALAQKQVFIERGKLAFDPDEVQVKQSQEQQAIQELEQKQRVIQSKINDTEIELKNVWVDFCQLAFEQEEGTSFYEAGNKMNAWYNQEKDRFNHITLEGLETEIETYNKKIADIIAEIAAINQIISELEKQIISQTPILGTTLTKAYLDDNIQERQFDTVILDEASMASIPALWCSAYLAEKNIIIVGDFRQLAPIVISENEVARKWLGQDIFYHSGVQKLYEANQPPSCLVALSQQFRMEKEIADLASRLYYRGMLKTGSSIQWQTEKTAFAEWYNGSAKSKCINILNTKELHAWVTGIPQGKGKTRLNHLSAILCVDLAFSLAENLIASKDYDQVKVLIISPYRAHAKRIQQLITHECQIRGIAEEDFNLIKAGTVHSIQGGEADIVIFDIVVDEPHWSNNLFMNIADANDSLQRMFNVAITRAKFKLFVVGNVEYCRRGAKDNALGAFLKTLIENKRVPVYDAKQYFPKLCYTAPKPSCSPLELSEKRLICTQENYFEFLYNDITTAQTQIIIYSPFMTQDRVSQVLPALQTALAKGVGIYIITKPVSEVGKKMQAAKTACERILKQNGASIIHKKHMHEKLVFIDDDILWTGSLNTLSFSDSQEIMERRADRTVFKNYMEQMNIEHLLKFAVNEASQSCPICRAEMLAAESDSGGIYWTCEACGYSRKKEEQPPVNGLLVCNKCGQPLSFKMVNEPRWICANRHYQKVRRCDLLLSKMRELIPSNQQLQVVNALRGKQKNDAEREILSLSTIRCFDDKGKLIAGHTSIQNAAEYVDTSPRNIEKALRGESKTAAGYQWRRYASGTPAVDIEPLPVTQPTNEAKAVLQLDKNRRLIAKHTSINQAAAATGIDKTSIRAVLQGKQKTAGGYCWCQEQ